MSFGKFVLYGIIVSVTTTYVVRGIDKGLVAYRHAHPRQAKA